MRVLLATTAVGDDRKTVACARALARAGAWVAVGSDRFWGQAYYSRFVGRHVRYPHPRLGVPSFIAAINEHVERDRLLVQEYVTGETRDACFLYDHGEPRSEFTQRRLRSYPSEGGVGTLVESTFEPGLLERAKRLLGALQWHGPAQVEFKVDPDTGRSWLIEVNGRFWGTIDLAVQAGVDFPLLTCRLALSQDVSSSINHAVGLRYRFPFPFGLLAMGDSGSRLHTAWEFFGPERGVRSDVVWSDPLPLLAEAFYIGRRAWDRRSLRPGRSRT